MNNVLTVQLVWFVQLEPLLKFSTLVLALAHRQTDRQLTDRQTDWLTDGESCFEKRIKFIRNFREYGLSKTLCLLIVHPCPRWIDPSPHGSNRHTLFSADDHVVVAIHKTLV